MTQGYLWELVQLAARIMELDQLESQLTDKRDWRAAKKEYDAHQEQFNKVRDEYVDALLEQDGVHDSAVDDVTQQLTELREQSDPSWHPAIDYTRDNLLPCLTKEAAKSPRLRKALKLVPLVVGGLAVLVYFGIRLASGTPVTEDFETRAGIQQRAAAAQKVIRYDDWMSTRVRRGGLFKGILLWPIEPTDAEVNGAAEFVSLVVEGQQYAEGCGSVSGFGENLTDEQIKMVGEVANYIQRDDIQWEEPPVMTVVVGLERASRC